MAWPLTRKRNVVADKPPTAEAYERSLVENPFPVDAQRAAEVAALRRRIADIDTRQAQITARLQQLRAGVLCYESSELSSEGRELVALKSVAQHRLTQLAAAPDQQQVAREKHRQALIEAAYCEQRANIERFIAKLEAEDSHRQARIWRTELLTLREKLERQIH